MESNFVNSLNFDFYSYTKSENRLTGKVFFYRLDSMIRNWNMYGSYVWNMYGIVEFDSYSNCMDQNTISFDINLKKLVLTIYPLTYTLYFYPLTLENFD